MLRHRGFTLLALVLVTLVMTAALPSSVNACSPSPIAPNERIATFVGQSTAIVVGEVVHEELTESRYSSRIRVVATLAVDLPTEVDIEQLGSPAECGSGPRLNEGERFLLFLTDQQLVAIGDLGTGVASGGPWRIASIGQGIYTLDDGAAAYYGELADPRQREPAGTAEGLIREVGEALGSDSREVERAVAFANGAEAGEPTIQTDGPNPFAMGGAVAIALIATGIIVAWYMRGRSRRRR